MKSAKLLILTMIIVLTVSPLCLAVETALRTSDQEVAERLIKVEEGHKAILREIDQRFEAVDKRFEDMNAQIRQLREDMNAQFDRIVNIMMAIVSAFAGIVAVTICFAVWDRRTMIRPFETKIKKIEDELAENRSKLHAVLESFKTLSKTDANVAEVLKRFNLL